MLLTVHVVFPTVLLLLRFTKSLTYAVRLTRLSCFTGCPFNSRILPIAHSNDRAFDYLITFNRQSADFSDAFCNLTTNTTMNRKASYEITATGFTSPFTLADFSFEFFGAPAVTIEIQHSGVALVYTVRTSIVKRARKI